MFPSVIRGAAFGAVFQLLMLQLMWMHGEALPWPKTALEWTAYAWGFVGCALVGIILFVGNRQLSTGDC